MKSNYMQKVLVYILHFFALLATLGYPALSPFAMLLATSALSAALVIYIT